MCFLPKSTSVSSRRRRRRRPVLPSRPPSDPQPAPRPDRRAKPDGQALAASENASSRLTRRETGQPCLEALAERNEQTGGHYEGP